MKIIKYYRKSVYGQQREYMSIENKSADVGRIMQLTGKETINANFRSLIEALTDGQIKFEEILAPK